VVRQVAGYHRYDTDAERLLLNEIWSLQGLLTNYFYPQQKLVSKVRHGAKVSKKHDVAATPHQRANRHPNLTKKITKVSPEPTPRSTQRPSNDRSKP
jgi:hypothetical protein